jgi:hypothetical protein
MHQKGTNLGKKRRWFFKILWAREIKHSSLLFLFMFLFLNSLL